MASACINLTGAARSVQLLKIDGFCTTKAMGTDDCIKSRWNVGGYEWGIHIYPSRMLTIGNDTRGVALQLIFFRDGCMPIVRANLRCRLVDPRGILEPSEEKSVSKIFNKYPDDPIQVSGERALPVILVSTRDLEASCYLQDDSFTVQCTITVLKDLAEVRIPVEELTVPSSNLHQHLGELLRSETGVDVTFVVAGESFAAHRAILASRSPVLMAEFFGHMREKSSQHVVIKDMEAAAFKAMLHFIYTDTVPELDQQLDVVATMAQHLLAAADRYGLDRLKLICENKLSSGISVDTAATTFALAEQHNCLQLKAKCVEFIIKTPAILGAVLATDGYKHLEASCPSVLHDLLKSACGRNS